MLLPIEASKNHRKALAVIHLTTKACDLQTTFLQCLAGGPSLAQKLLLQTLNHVLKVCFPSLEALVMFRSSYILETLLHMFGRFIKKNALPVPR